MRIYTLVLVALLGATLFLARPDFDMFNVRTISPPPDAYRVLYEQTEDCLDVDGNFGDVHWFVADSILDADTGDRYAGVRYGDNIFLSKRYFNVDTYIRHEAIHHILGTAGYDSDADHDEWMWEECVKLPLPDGVDRAGGFR